MACRHSGAAPVPGTQAEPSLANCRRCHHGMMPRRQPQHPGGKRGPGRNYGTPAGRAGNSWLNTVTESRVTSHGVTVTAVATSLSTVTVTAGRSSHGDAPSLSGPKSSLTGPHLEPWYPMTS